MENEKRTSKCPGCKEPIEQHGWGISSKYCEGRAKSSPQKSLPSLEEQGQDLEHLARTLQSLERQEDSLRKSKRIKEEPPQSPETDYKGGEDIESLSKELEFLELKEKELQRRKAAEIRQRIATKKASVQELLAESTTSHGSPDTTRTSPLDDLLKSSAATGGYRWPQAQNTTHMGAPLTALSQQHTSTSEMFLTPATSMNKGEKVLTIIDFIDNIIPLEEEEMLGRQGSTRIVVSYGPKKIKLENVTLQQWVIANTRIFNALVTKGKLPTHDDVQHYLAYTIKIMELANRYEWKSVLMYDNEFRKIQAMYNYPWSFDSNHLHTVTLTPLTTQATINNSTRPRDRSSNALNSFASLTADSKVICRNFNSPRGCNFSKCAYAHVCNRKVPGGKACGQPHAGCTHNGTHSSTITNSQPQ